MDPLEAYLATIKRFLPRDQADDLLPELRDHLLSQMEDREASLGRSLTESEQVTLIKAHGDPLTVAGRFRNDGQCLAFGRQYIGPVVFPFYSRVLGLSLALTLAVLAVVLGADLLTGHAPADLLQTLVFNLLVTFLAVTGIFMALDQHQATLGASWEKGYRRKAEPPSTAHGWFQRRPGPRFRAGAAFIALSIYLAFWLALPTHGLLLLMGPAAGLLDAGPGWGYFYRCGTVLLLGHLALEAVTFALPGHARLRWAGDLVLDGASVAILGWGLTHGAWQVAAGGSGHLMHGRPLAEAFNGTVRTGLSYLVPLLAVLLIVRAVRNFKRKQPEGASV